MKSCNVYLDSDHIFVIASAETTYGFNVASLPMKMLPRTAKAEALGATVQEALNAYTRGVPVPKDLSKADKALLAFTGYKSLRSFEQKASCVLVEAEAETVKATPSIRGSEGGFLFQPEHAVMAECDSEKIGRAILEAAVFSEGGPPSERTGCCTP